MTDSKDGRLIFVYKNLADSMEREYQEALNALITKATEEGYTLVPADIMMPTFMKGN